MKPKYRRENVQPRPGETHGLFGVKFLKHHNMRDPNWTSEDLITQYEKLSNIFRKANNVADLQREQDEKQTIDDYKRMKKELKDKHEFLQTLLKGDKQRTKNVLQDHPMYQRTYQNKQSYEVLQELSFQAFQKRKKLDLYLSEKRKLMKQYEEELLEVALKQEMVNYYDIKEFKEEKDTKRLFVDLKNSETRSRAVQKINTAYKNIIDQLLKSSLYYQPVLEALNCDWNEQTTLVRQTFEIGFPAIQNVKKLEKELKKLQKVSKKEESMRLDNIAENSKILKRQPKIVKELVRRDSDFSLLGSHYDRDTRSMTNLKVQVENIESTIKMLKRSTLCSSAKEICSRVEQQPDLNKQRRQQIAKREEIRNTIKEQDEIAKLVHELLLDDLPQIYNDEQLNEILMLENSIKVEKDKQKTHSDHMGKRTKLLMLLRLALQHMLDVLRHVGSPDVFKNLEYTTVELKLPLLKFNTNLPPPPLIMETDASKLLTSVKTCIKLLMQHHQKESDRNVNESTAKFQQAMIEDSVRTFLPRKPSLDFD